MRRMMVVVGMVLVVCLSATAVNAFWWGIGTGDPPYKEKEPCVQGKGACQQKKEECPPTKVWTAPPAALAPQPLKVEEVKKAAPPATPPKVVKPKVAKKAKAKKAEVKKEEKIEVKKETTPLLPAKKVVTEEVAADEVVTEEVAADEIATEEVMAEDDAEEEIAEVAPKPSVKAPAKKVTFPKVYVDMTVFGGSFKRVSETGNGNYYGGDATFYPLRFGRFDVGVNANYVQYGGYDYDGVAIVNQDWKGDEFSYGAAVKANFRNAEVVLKVGQTKRNSEFSNSLNYRNKESREGMYFTLSPTWLRGEDFFHTVELSGTYKLYNTGKKESWFNNAVIPTANDPQTEQNDFFATLKTELYRQNDYLAWVVGTSYWDNKSDSSVTPFAGVKVAFRPFELTVTGGQEACRVQPNKWRGDAALNFKY